MRMHDKLLLLTFIVFLTGDNRGFSVTALKPLMLKLVPPSWSTPLYIHGNVYGIKLASQISYFTYRAVVFRLIQHILYRSILKCLHLLRSPWTLIAAVFHFPWYILKSDCHVRSSISLTAGITPPPK